MGEVINFPGNKDSAEPAQADKEFVFPSMELLYDEEQITVLVKGDYVNVARLKRLMKENSKAKALRNLETELTQARGVFISNNARTPEARKEGLVGLAKHAYSVGRGLEHQDLMDWARNELIRGLGTTQAMVIIENIQLKDSIPNPGV